MQLPTRVPIFISSSPKYTLFLSDSADHAAIIVFLYKTVQTIQTNIGVRLAHSATVQLSHTWGVLR